MLQSCGTLSERQPLSSKSGFSASARSEWMNRQSASNDCVTRDVARDCSAAAAVERIAGPNVVRTKISPASRIGFLQTAEDLDRQKRGPTLAPTFARRSVLQRRRRGVGNARLGKLSQGSAAKPRMYMRDFGCVR